MGVTVNSYCGREWLRAMEGNEECERELEWWYDVLCCWVGYVDNTVAELTRTYKFWGSRSDKNLQIGNSAIPTFLIPKIKDRK